MLCERVVSWKGHGGKKQNRYCGGNISPQLVWLKSDQDYNLQCKIVCDKCGIREDVEPTEEQVEKVWDEWYDGLED